PQNLTLVYRLTDVGLILYRLFANVLDEQESHHLRHRYHPEQSKYCVGKRPTRSYSQKHPSPDVGVARISCLYYGCCLYTKNTLRVVQRNPISKSFCGQSIS